MGLRMMSLAGLAVFIGIAWLCSENRKRIDWRLVLWGLGLQFAVGLLVLHSGLRGGLFTAMQTVFGALTDSAKEGSRFVFGNLVDPFVIRGEALAGGESDLVVAPVVAFQVLPVVIFVSSLAAVLYHLGVIQLIVRAIAWLMRRTLKTSGAETFGAALLVFFGIESLTAIRAYLAAMTRSELCTVATAFMATIAASVMVAYASFGAEPGHLLTASLMSAPAAILLSKILVPETGTPQTLGAERIELDVKTGNVVDAAAQGASEGLKLALNIAGMLIAFVALVHLLNILCTAVTGLGFIELLSYAFYPLAALLGVPWPDVPAVAQLLGTKVVVTEFIAYQSMQAMTDAGELGPRAHTLATYALCGFTHPASLAILIAGFTGLVPERREEIVAVGLKAFLGGFLACMMTACVAGVLTSA